VKILSRRMISRKTYSMIPLSANTRAVPGRLFSPVRVCQSCGNEIRRGFPLRDPPALRKSPRPLFLSFLSCADPCSHHQFGVKITYAIVAIYDAVFMISLPPVSKRRRYGGKIGNNGALEHKVCRETVTPRRSLRPSPAETPSQRVNN
jgi:hypothetical protein